MDWPDATTDEIRDRDSNIVKHTSIKIVDSLE